MKRWIWLLVGAAVVAGGVVVLMHHRDASAPSANAKTSSSMPDMNMNANPSTDSSASATPTIATSAVTIKDFSFGPQNITVKAGTTVTWTNHDSTSHTVSADVSSSNSPSSSEIAPGKSFSFVFSVPGTYAYHCAIHPSMQGTVTVTR